MLILILLLITIECLYSSCVESDKFFDGSKIAAVGEKRKRLDLDNRPTKKRRLNPNPFNNYSVNTEPATAKEEIQFESCVSINEMFGGERDVSHHEKSSRNIYVLSVDGGGIRGIGSLYILKELEKETGKKIFEIFDRFYGTSTGGLIALLISLKYSAKEILKIYKDNCRNIFGKSYLDPIPSFGYILPKYSNNGLKKTIQRYAFERKLESSEKPVCVTSVDRKTNKLILLSSELEETKNLTYTMSALATSAAPTYFPSVSINYNGRNIDCIDGGVSANDPSLVSYIHTISHMKDEFNKKIEILSIGTGEKDISTFKNNAGIFSLLNPKYLLNLFMGISQAQASSVTEYLKKHAIISRYDRFQFYIKSDIRLDDVSSDTIKALKKAAINRCREKDFSKYVEIIKSERPKVNHET